ncbi:MAG: hypothetical protein R3B48_03240 [Kofleriaceae bacterium]
MSRRQQLILVAVAVAAGALGAACATTPYSGQEVTTNTIPVAGFGNAPGAPVRLYGWDWSTSKYFYVSSTTTAIEPTFAAGVICPNSPDLYAYSGSITLQWPFYWQPQPGGYRAKIKATQFTSGTTPLWFADNPGAVNCLIAAGFNSTCEFGNIAYACGFNTTEPIVTSTSLGPWN